MWIISASYYNYLIYHPCMLSIFYLLPGSGKTLLFKCQCSKWGFWDNSQYDQSTISIKQQELYHLISHYYNNVILSIMILFVNLYYIILLSLCTYFFRLNETVLTSISTCYMILCVMLTQNPEMFVQTL